MDAINMNEIFLFYADTENIFVSNFYILHKPVPLEIYIVFRQKIISAQ